MKNRLALLFTLMISVAVFGQKKELKALEKTIKKGDFKAAIEQLDAVESLIANVADDKLKGKFYFAKVKAYYANGTAPFRDQKTGEAIKELKKFERKTGKLKYSKVIQPYLETILKRVEDRSVKNYNEKKYPAAVKDFELLYELDRKDTTSLENAGQSAFFAKNYNKTIELFQKLLDMGYTGIRTDYKAINAVTNQPMYFASEKDMKNQVKLGAAKNPESIVSESRVGDCAKFIAYSYIALKDDAKALEAIENARKSFPNDYGLILNEAEIYEKLGNTEKNAELLDLAVSLRPNDPNLHVNVGTLKFKQGKSEDALKHFMKAIELKPDFALAYNNAGVMVLEDDKAIVEKLNNLPPTDFAGYDKLMAKRKVVYKKALGYFEKALEYDQENVDTMQMLSEIYSLLEMYDEQKAMRAKMDLYK